MPQVKNSTVKDGWYVNQAKDRGGKPRALSLGAVMTMKPGAERHFKAVNISESRATHQAFLAALANGNLVPKGGAPKAVEVVEEVKVADVPIIDQKTVEEAEVGEVVEETLTRSDLQSMNKASLVDMAEGMGLDDDGTKNELIDRILVSQD